jgi:hypothetical protein
VIGGIAAGPVAILAVGAIAIYFGVCLSRGERVEPFFSDYGIDHRNQIIKRNPFLVDELQKLHTPIALEHCLSQCLSSENLCDLTKIGHIIV